jgi:hypothetical protein
MAEHPLDAVALLIEIAVVFNLHSPVGTPRDDGLDVPAGEVCADGIGVISLVAKQCIRRLFGQVDQRVVCLAISGFAARQVECDRSSKGIGQAVKLTGEPAPRAAKSASMNPPLPPAAETWPRTVVLSML